MECLGAALKIVLERLLEAGVEQAEARREAELILQHVTGFSRAQLLLRADADLDAEQARQVKDIVGRRAKRIPLQYCLGYGWFDGMRLKVKPGVFIPRPDTETLLEVVSLLLLPLAQEPVLLVGEIGIGSGAISIALLRRFSQLQVVACDISPAALSQAQENAEEQGVGGRLELKLGDWTEVLPGRLSLIVSNPPYIPSSQESLLEPEVRDHEPSAALFGWDEDGLGFYRQLAKAGPGLLRAAQSGAVVEVGDGQAPAVADIFRANAWLDVQIHDDVNGLGRAVSAIRPLMNIC